MSREAKDRGREERERDSSSRERERERERERKGKLDDRKVKRDESSKTNSNEDTLPYSTVHLPVILLSPSSQSHVTFDLRCLHHPYLS